MNVSQTKKHLNAECDEVTQSGLVTPKGNINLDEHLPLGQCTPVIIGRHQGITWTNVETWNGMSCACPSVSEAILKSFSRTMV